MQKQVNGPRQEHPARPRVIYAIPGMLDDDLVSLLAWVVAAGLDRSAEQRPESNLGCALTMASPQVEEKMADHVISVRDTEVL